jgi:hypothetical protein
MEIAYKVAAAAVRQRFAEQHPDYLTILDRISEDEVAVYSGTYDRVEDILDYLRVPIARNSAANNLKAKIIFINCSDNYNNHPIEELKQQKRESQ